jgi:hypothetical protein
MKFAYADPPYLGCCSFYNHNHPDGHCWDELQTHQLLVDRLQSEFFDGWVMSLSSTTLREILPLCPPDIRIGAWVKPFCAFKKFVRPAYGWEPVIFRGGRNPCNGYRHDPPQKKGTQTTPKDFLIESITLQKGLVGAKPRRFCEWVLDLLNAGPDDEVIDLFPGTGIMGRVASGNISESTSQMLLSHPEV